jgi:hypothetical protein
MPTESWVLDGLILTGGNFSLMELNADPPRERRDWVTAADTENAALFRQPKHENRTITMKLRVTPQASMNTALDQVGALVDKLRKASGTSSGIGLVWTPGGATRSATFTVLAGEISGLPISLEGDGYLWIVNSPVVTVELTCQPYGVGTRVVFGSSTTNSTPLQTLELTTIPGDIPALGELIVTDLASQARRHVEWGIEGPLTYNAATSLLVDSDDMVTSGFSGAGAVTTGAYDPNSAGNNSVSLALVAASTTAVCGTGNLSHVGVFRVKARVQSGSLLNQFRLSWKAGDGPMNHNPWVTTISTTGWIELDLGTITVPTTISGTQRWTGQVEVAAATTSPGTAVVDYLILVPQADGYGLARGVYSYSTGILVGQDSFTSFLGGINTRVAPLGGTWVSSGDASDLTGTAAVGGTGGPDAVVRSSTTDTNGRYAILGATSYTDTQVDVVTYLFSAPSVGLISQAAVARWTDASNHVRAVVETGVGYSTGVLRLRQLVAGTPTDAATVAFTIPSQTVGVTGSVGVTRLRLLAFASGRAIAQVFNYASTLLAQTEFSTTALATGGTLASGKPGIWDFNTAGSGRVRAYDDVTVAVASPEPIAIYSTRTLQVRYDDTIRDDSTATYTGRPQSYRGSRCLIPVGTSRVLAKARRNDVVTALDDQVTDSTKIQVAYTPRFLAVPR